MTGLFVQSRHSRGLISDNGNSNERWFGKSTVTFNLAVWLSMAGQEVLADVDPQATLSDVAEVRGGL